MVYGIFWNIFLKCGGYHRAEPDIMPNILYLDWFFFSIFGLKSPKLIILNLGSIKGMSHYKNKLLCYRISFWSFYLVHDTFMTIRVVLTVKFDLFFMDIKPYVWFIIRRQNIVELFNVYIGNFSPRWEILGGKTKYEGLFLNFSHSAILVSIHPHNLSLQTIFYAL